MKRLALLATLAICLIVVGPAQAVRDFSGTARNIVPSGEWGGVPVPERADSQARMYDGLTPLFDAEWIALSPPPDGDDQGWDTVATQGELAQWEAAWAGGGDVTGLFQSALLADPASRLLGLVTEEET